MAMKTDEAILQNQQFNGEELHISREKLVALISSSYAPQGENPNPDDVPRPGPWDPIIHKVSRQFFGPSPQPWRSESTLEHKILEIIAERHPAIYDVIGGGRFNWAALNPQPLPPKAAFVMAFTEEVLDRVLLMQEIADSLNDTGNQRGIIIVSGKLSMLVDELCGNNFKIKIPIPHPKHDPHRGLSGMELLMAATVCEKTAHSCSNIELHHELRRTSNRLIEEGIARM